MNTLRGNSWCLSEYTQWLGFLLGGLPFMGLKRKGYLNMKGHSEGGPLF